MPRIAKSLKKPCPLKPCLPLLRERKGLLRPPRYLAFASLEQAPHRKLTKWRILLVEVDIVSPEDSFRKAS